jgi:ferrous iron transport protein A
LEDEFVTLDELESGREAEVVDVHLEGAELQRMLDMGFVEGTPLRVIRNAPLLDPIDVSIRDCQIAVRRNEAKGVEVKLT